MCGYDRFVGCIALLYWLVPSWLWYRIFVDVLRLPCFSEGLESFTRPISRLFFHSDLPSLARCNRRIPLTILSRRLRRALHVMMIVRNNFGGAPLFECHAIRSSGPATAPRGRGKRGCPTKSFDVNFRLVPLSAFFVLAADDKIDWRVIFR